MKKLVIFDLDGTLLNTIADLAHSIMNHALRQNGFPTHDVKEYNFFVGNGINKLFERALPEGEKTEENILKVREEFLKHYDLHNTDRSVPYPGIPSYSLVAERGIKLAVASNKYQAATRKLIAHFFPSIQFTEVLGQREGVKAKPDPSIVNEIVERASISKENALYVGDSDVDMQTAHQQRSDLLWGNMGLSPSYGIREIRTRSYSGKGRRYTQVYLKYDLSLPCEAILPVLVSHACP